MESVSEALTYPMEDEDWITTVVIGGVLTLLGVLLIPLFLVYGYIVQAIRERVEGATQPPQFENWGDLLIDGLKAWVIGLVYMLVPLIVFGVTVGTSVMAMATGTRAGAGAGMAGLLGGMLLSFVLALVFGYFAAVAIVHFACTEKFGSAFDVGTLRKVGLSSDFAIPWLVTAALFIGANIVVNFFNVIPFIGTLIAWVLGGFATFYVAIVAADLWAGGYKAALGETDETESVGTAAV